MLRRCVLTLAFALTPALRPVQAQADAPAAVRSALADVPLPNGTILDKGMFGRAAGRVMIDLSLSPLGMTSGDGFEMFKLAPADGSILTNAIHDAFRAQGWRMTPLPALANGDQQAWSEKNSRKLYVYVQVKGKNPQLYLADAVPAKPSVATNGATAKAAPLPGSPTSAASPKTSSAQTPTTTSTTTSSIPASPTPTSPTPTVSSYFYGSTKFDDGWLSTAKPNWVEVTKGDITVFLHHPRPVDQTYESVLAEQTRKAWNSLVAPRYRDAKALFIERFNVGDFESINFAEGDLTDAATGRSVHVVLMKKNIPSGRWTEIVTPDKATYEREFGPYLVERTNWNPLLALLRRNRFGVGPSDVSGTWTDDWSGATEMVYAGTGWSAGLMYAGGSTSVVFGGGRYEWSTTSGTGMTGSVKWQSQTKRGTVSVPDLWTVTLVNGANSEAERYNAWFEAVSGGRILTLDMPKERGYPVTYHLIRAK